MTDEHPVSWLRNRIEDEDFLIYTGQYLPPRDSSRAARELKAKQRLLAEYDERDAALAAGKGDTVLTAEFAAFGYALRVLAEVYADEEDGYQEQWRP